jgi:16S rRNA (cytosine1402-N4)-methyltransferase
VEAVPLSFTAVQRKALIADDEEVNMNPRARSAKLRIAERTDAPAHSDDPLAVLLNKIPSLDREAR